jgi:DNA (cytosine-5)-methyltransferase 1
MRLSQIDIDGLLARIDELLEARYNSAELGNYDDPLAEAVYILLSKQTREAVYRRVFDDLRKRYPLWRDVQAAPDEELEAVLEPAGFQRQRTEQLKALLYAIESANQQLGIGPAASPPGDLTLDFLQELKLEEAERFLLELPSIGPKSARCILVYSLDQPAFAVDTHVHRVFVRLALAKSNGRKNDHDTFQSIVPEEMRKRLHINLVHHGRSICRTQKAQCGECFLISFCKQGRKAIGRDNSKPVAIDLFAGAGGLSYGFAQAGFRIALAIEADRNAAQTYRFNNPGIPVIEAEIDKTTKATMLRKFIPGVKKVSVLLAGPPCQGYSMAGSRNPTNPANMHYRHVTRLACELGVDIVCIENVPGIHRINGQGFLNRIIRELEKAEFNAAAHLLHACDYGVPQHRARFFFLAIKGKELQKIEAPKATHYPHHSNPDEEAGLSRKPTPRLEDLLAILPELPSGVLAERYIDSNGEEYFNLSTMRHSRDVIDKIKRISPGEGPISYRRLELEEARTLIAGHRALPVHPKLDRAISVREAAVIQGFPLDYYFCGPRASQPLQVANAVPPPLAEAVAREIIKRLRD